MADRSATSVLFGFDFQANAAIVLMLENIKDMSHIRLEGCEDIDIKLMMAVTSSLKLNLLLKVVQILQTF